MHPAIKLRHIRAFLDIAADGNLSAVARAQGITQPALSRTLAELEALLDQPLFLRQGRRMVLTEAGTVFRRHALAGVQALAARRPDLVRAVVLSNTAAKMGTPEAWSARIAAVQAGGIESIGDAVMERWFAPAFRATPALSPWRNMLTRTDAAGYCAACAAIAGADLTPTTRALRLPTLVIAGDQDGASPPDLVRGTAEMIAGAAFHILPGAGHLPCVETPEAWAARVAPFLTEHAR